MKISWKVTLKDILVGLGGGAIFALGVYAINYGEPLAAIAAAKQFVYSFFISIAVVRFAEYGARKRVKEGKSYPAFIGGLPAVLFAIIGVYIVHQLKGTPYPLLSILPTLLVSPPSLWGFAYKAAQKEKVTV